MSLKDADHYLQTQFPDIDGWCTAHLWQTIQPLYRDMVQRGPVGPVAEIGVYHGKFFLGLVKTVASPAQNHAIDVFDRQALNLDGSGAGSLDRFRQALRDCEVDEAAVEIVCADSMALTRTWVAEVEAKTGGFSFFSIDGCHRVEHTVNDLEIACALTRPSGIIFVDDYYNPSWPGVHEGVARWYFSRPRRFVPLLFSCNKLYLCHLSHHAHYLACVDRFVRTAFPSTHIKAVERYGYPSLTVTPDLSVPQYIKGISG